MTQHDIQQAADLLAAATNVAVLTGAGVSRESGVPTFRDAYEGLWAKYDPTQLATPQAFLSNPKLVWQWYEYRRDIGRRARPNPGHYALAELEQHHPNMTIITQNVDDLHEQAGSRNVVHLHGNLARNRCFYDCQGDGTLLQPNQFQPAQDQDGGPPLCPYCGRHVRPDVVWFGEMLPQEELAIAFTTSQHTDLMLVVGTSGLVTPAAALPGIAHDNGAKIIEVNPSETPITPLADLHLHAPSGEILPLVVQALTARQ